jgi:hypothetical protein
MVYVVKMEIFHGYIKEPDGNEPFTLCKLT